MQILGVFIGMYFMDTKLTRRSLLQIGGIGQAVFLVRGPGETEGGTCPADADWLQRRQLPTMPFHSHAHAPFCSLLTPVRPQIGTAVLFATRWGGSAALSCFAAAPAGTALCCALPAATRAPCPGSHMCCFAAAARASCSVDDVKGAQVSKGIAAAILVMIIM